MTWLKLDFRDKVLEILKRKNLCPKTSNSNFIPKIFLMVIEKFPSEKKGTFLKPSDASQSIPHFYYLGVTRSITTPLNLDGMLVHRKVTSISSCFPDNLAVPIHIFIFLGQQRHCESKVFCPKHNTFTPPVLTLGPLYQEASKLSIIPLHLPNCKVRSDAEQ